MRFLPIEVWKREEHARVFSHRLCAADLVSIAKGVRRMAGRAGDGGARLPHVPVGW